MSTPFLSARRVSPSQPLAPQTLGIVGVPYDGAVTYRSGAALGPNEIRAASESIESYCPRLDLDLEAAPIYDYGNLNIPDHGDGETRMREVSRQLAELPAIDDLPLVALGGDHLVAYPFLARAIQAHPNLAIFHIDAHTDLRDEWEGEPFNHATVIRRTLDLMGSDASLWSWGIRSGLKSEFELARSDARIQLIDNTRDAGLAAVAQLKALRRPVYFTIDADGIDPCDIPGTGTPEPDGLRFGDVEQVLRAFVSSGCAPHLLGADFVELAPALDPSGRSNVAAARLVRTLLLILRKSQGANQDG